MENFRRSPAWEKMAAELIENDELLVIQNAMQVKVVCVLSETMKKDARRLPIYAEAEKIPPKYKWATDADAMITIYENNMTTFNEQKKKIALLRELLKITVDVDTDTGDHKVIIGDYDLQDFRSVVNRYGTDWDQAPTLFDEVNNED